MLIDKVKDFCQNFTAVLAILGCLVIAINLPLKIIWLLVFLSLLSLIGADKLDGIRERFLSSIPPKGLPVVKLY